MSLNHYPDYVVSYYIQSENSSERHMQQQEGKESKCYMVMMTMDRYDVRPQTTQDTDGKKEGNMASHICTERL